MLRSFKNKALRNYWMKNDSSGIHPDWVPKIKIILDTLNATRALDDVKSIGFNFHRLKEPRKGVCALSVSPNWRVTFRMRDGDAVDVDLEDYHGR